MKKRKVAFISGIGNRPQPLVTIICKNKDCNKEFSVNGFKNNYNNPKELPVKKCPHCGFEHNVLIFDVNNEYK